MAQPKIIADFETQLSTAIAVGGTSFSISSATDDDGVSLPSGTYYFTIDNGTSAKEYLAGSLSGTSVTSVVSVSRQGAETSGAARAHRVGASVILTDFATYKNYIDEVAIAGVSDASATQKGIVEMATSAEINAGTATGSTGAALSLAPDTFLASNYGVLLGALTGVVLPYGGSSAPTGWLLCDGTAVSRTTYATLFGIVSTSFGVGNGSTTFNLPDLRGRAPIGAGTGTKVATFASRSGNVITVTGLSDAANNEFQTGKAVLYTAASGAMTGLTHNTTYYLIRTGNLTFSLASSLANAIAGTVIALSSDGTGTQTFTLTLTARTLGHAGGEENHGLVIGEIPAHTHSLPDNTAGGVSGGDVGALTNTTQSYATGSAGGSAEHNIMQPFVALNYIIKT